MKETQPQVLEKYMTVASKNIGLAKEGSTYNTAFHSRLMLQSNIKVIIKVIIFIGTFPITDTLLSGDSPASLYFSFGQYQ